MRARRLAPRPTSWTSWPWPTRQVRRTGPQGIAGRRLRRQWRRPGLAAEGRAARLAGQGRLRPEQGPGLRRGRKPQRPAHPQADRDPARRDRRWPRSGPTHRRSAQAARRCAFSEMASQLSKQVYDQRDSLQPVADAVGLKLRTATGVTREGLLPADKAGPLGRRRSGRRAAGQPARAPGAVLGRCAARKAEFRRDRTGPGHHAGRARRRRGAGPRAAAGQGQRNHPRQAAGRAFGRSRPSGRRSRAGRRQGQSGRLARRFRRCGDGVAPGSWRPAARGAGRHHAPAGRPVARLRGRRRAPTRWLAWRRSSPARSSRPSARAWRASCPEPMARPRTRRVLREQYKVQVLPASADAIRASSPPRRADPC